MEKEEIKASIKFLTEQIKNYLDDKYSYERKVADAQEKINKVHTEISRIRNKCKHKYPLLPKDSYGFIGKGNCLICGYSDY